MSGEFFRETVQSYPITNKNFKHNIHGSNYQLESLSFGGVKNVPEFRGDKLLTEKQTQKLISKYERNIDEVIGDYQNRDKYSFYAAALGVVSFDKLKPVYTKSPKLPFAKPSKTKVDGYIVNAMRFIELTEAKKFAKESFMKNGADVIIYKEYVNSYGSVRGKLEVARVRGEYVGSVKSLPKSTPKSFVIVPKLLYVVEGCLIDAEYEWN